MVMVFGSLTPVSLSGHAVYVEVTSLSWPWQSHRSRMPGVRRVAAAVVSLADVKLPSVTSSASQLVAFYRTVHIKWPLARCRSVPMFLPFVSVASLPLASLLPVHCGDGLRLAHACVVVGRGVCGRLYHDPQVIEVCLEWTCSCRHRWTIKLPSVTSSTQLVAFYRTVHIRGRWHVAVQYRVSLVVSVASLPLARPIRAPSRQMVMIGFARSRLSLSVAVYLKVTSLSWPATGSHRSRCLGRRVAAIVGASKLPSVTIR